MSPLLSPLFALEINGHPGLWESIRYQAVGISIVFIALGILALLISFIGKAFQSLDKPASAQNATAASKNVAPSSTGAGQSGASGTQVQKANLSGITQIKPTPDAATTVVIAAAVAAMLGRQYKIISIAPRSESDMAWSRAGRTEIWASHRL